MFSYSYVLKFFSHRRDQDLGSFVTPKFTKSIKLLRAMYPHYLGKSSEIASCCLQFPCYGLKWHIISMPRFVGVQNPRDHAMWFTLLNSGCSQFPLFCLFSQHLKLYFRLPVLAINPYSIEHTIFPVFFNENFQTYRKVRRIISKYACTYPLGSVINILLNHISVHLSIPQFINQSILFFDRFQTKSQASGQFALRYFNIHIIN